MKFITAYYLLLLYVTAIFKPFIPVISDVWQHAFNETEHVCKVHAVYGEKHAETEFAKAGAENDNGKNQSTLRSQEPMPVHVLAGESIAHISLAIIEKTYPELRSYHLPHLYNAILIQPPKGC